MPASVRLEHITRYTYPPNTTLSPQVVRLRPAPHTRTPIKSYMMEVTPSDHFINWQQDPFGNHLARIVFPSKVESFEVKISLVAELVTVNPFDFFLEPEAENYPFDYSDTLQSELAPYLEVAEAGGEDFYSWMQSIEVSEHPTVSFLLNVKGLEHCRLRDQIRRGCANPG